MSTAVSASVNMNPFHRSDSNQSLEELNTNSSDEMNETMFPPPPRCTEMMPEHENDTTPPVPSSSTSVGSVVEGIADEDEEPRIERQHDCVQEREHENGITSPRAPSSTAYDNRSVVHKIVKEK